MAEMLEQLGFLLDQLSVEESFVRADASNRSMHIRACVHALRARTACTHVASRAPCHAP